MFQPSSESCVSVRQVGTTVEIIASGDWDLARRVSILQAVGAALGHDPESVVLDLSRLTFIDSSGIQCVLELQQACAREETRLVVIPAPRPIQHIFEICGLIDSLPFIGSRP